MNMKLRNIPFSPPDMTEEEAKEVREAILSGWITTGPRTKKLEQEYHQRLLGLLPASKVLKIVRAEGQFNRNTFKRASAGK